MRRLHPPLRSRRREPFLSFRTEDDCLCSRTLTWTRPQPVAQAGFQLVAPDQRFPLLSAHILSSGRRLASSAAESLPSNPAWRRTRQQKVPDTLTWP